MSPIMLDIILIAVIAGICIFAYIKGLFIALFNFGSSIVAMIAAYIFHPIFADLLEKTPLFNAIKEPIFEALDKAGTDMGLKTVEAFVQELNLPSVISNKILQQVNSQDTSVMVSQISDVLTGIIISVIAVVVLFIIIKLLLLLLKNVIKGLVKLPVIRETDKIGGLVLGVLEAFVLLTVIGAVFTLFSGSVDGSFMEAVDNSIIARFFYYNNLIIALLR